METFGAMIFIINLLILIAEKTQTKPVPENELRNISGSQTHNNGGREYRSIPEVDAVNPAYFDFESQQPDQEQPMDPRGDVSQLSLADHVANLFRNPKPAKLAQRVSAQARPALRGEHTNDLAREEESVGQGGMSSDEQEECYRQQNLEPPRVQRVEARPALQGERTINLASEEESVDQGGVPADEQEDYNKRQNPEPSASNSKWNRKQSGQVRPALRREGNINMAREKSVDQGDMPADEQEAFNRRQNLQPSVSNFKWNRVHSGLSVPMVDDGQVPAPGFVRNTANADFRYKERGHFNEKERGIQEVNSLYDGPEKVLKFKEKKYRNEEHEPVEYKVYKPVGVDVEFPIYDQDLDFNPDPLQGILDDKYWLDPLERESVVRKYIDLASDNMMPDGYQYEKRSAEANVKSIDSKSRFKSYDNQCPCKDISACGECSKGKSQKKTNSSDNNDFGVSYGRKLLALNYDLDDNVDDFNGNEGDVGNHKAEITREVSEENFVDIPLKRSDVSEETQEEETQIHENAIHSPNFMGRKLLSYELDDDDDDEELEGLPEDVILTKSINYDTKHKTGKRLLWYDHYDNEKTYNFGDDNDDTIENKKLHKSLNGQEEEYYEPHFLKSKQEIESSNGEFTNLPSISEKKLIEGGFPLKRHSSYDTPGYFEPNKLANALEKTLKEKPKGLIKNISYTSFDDELKKGYVNVNSNPDLLNTFPKYYQINHAGNAIQKPFQEKPKGPPKNRTDIASEFNKLKVDTLKNATFEATSEYPSRTCFKRSQEDIPKLSKGRRSYSDIMFFGKHAESPHLQSSEDLALTSTKEGNKTANVLQNNATSFSQTNGSTPSNFSVSHLNKTGNVSKPNEDELSSEVSSLGSQVANNIVESVISDTQKSSVFGHDLGVCRKNESVIKVKYGKIVPEAEKVLKSVTDCIMERIRSHLAKQSCILLEPELLEFLKWMVLGGESYKDYMQKLGPKYYDFIPTIPVVQTTCANPTTQTCEMEPLPPNPNVQSSLDNNEFGSVFV